MKERNQHRLVSEETIKMVGMEGGRRPSGIPTIFCKFFCPLDNCLHSLCHCTINSCVQNNSTGEDLEDDQHAH